ncbi:MAG TPA: hypothetical protein VGB63_07100 [Pedobacter sp.]|jgi:hypothetical protein
MNFRKLILNGFKIGLAFNLLTLLLSISYIIAIENYFKPFNFSRQSVKLGTILTAQAMFDFKNFHNLQPLPRWKKIEGHFDFFVPDTALRNDDRKIKSPRLERWCKINPCWAHRMNYNDSRRRDYKVFTIDDWFFKNKSFLRTRLENAQVFPLDVFLKTLPPDSVVVLNEPLTLFQQHSLNFKLFTDWVILLRRKHPHLKFKLGLQLHFQWLDSQWLRLQDGVLFSQFEKFSADYAIPWGISEFSIYDRVWRRRLKNSYDRSGRRTDGMTSWIESAVPHRLRRAIVLHQSYLTHRAVIQSGASYIVEWGNFPTI